MTDTQRFKPLEPLRDWVFPLPHGYYAKTVQAQFPDNVRNVSGTFDVLDVSNGYVAMQLTGDLGCMSLYCAFYWVANYGMSGRRYVIRQRAGSLSYQVLL